MWPWVLGGVAGFWLLSKLQGGGYGPRVRTDPHGHRTPPGPEVAAQHKPMQWPRTDAGRQSFVRWMAQQLAAAHLLSAQSIPLFITHVARETGYGRAVYNFNFGNEKQFGPGPWMRLADHEPYMAFASAAQGLAHSVQRIARQWPGPWAKLQAGDPTWYGDLGLGGYYEYQPPADPNTGVRPTPRRHTPDTIGSVQAEYDSMLQTVRRYLRAAA